MPQLVPPVPSTSATDSPEYLQFLELLRKQANQPVFYAATSDPGVAGVPNGSWAVWLNTTSGVMTLWANQNGVLKSVTLT